MTDAGRPQDQGRPHRRRGRPSAETASLLAEYQAAMRDELRACLAELKGTDPAPGLDLSGKPTERQRPSLTERMRLWDLAIKVGKELGTSIEPPTAPKDEPAAPRPPRRKRIDYGGA